MSNHFKYEPLPRHVEMIGPHEVHVHENLRHGFVVTDPAQPATSESVRRRYPNARKIICVHASFTEALRLAANILGYRVKE